MNNKVLTINNIGKNINCNCITVPCNCGNSEIKKPELATDEDIKAIISKGKEVAKTNLQNTNFQKGALAVTALICLYVIFK